MDHPTSVHIYINPNHVMQTNRRTTKAEQTNKLKMYKKKLIYHNWFKRQQRSVLNILFLCSRLDVFIFDFLNSAIYFLSFLFYEIMSVFGIKWKISYLTDYLY